MKGANRIDSVKEYYFSKKLREVAQLQSQGKSIVNMAIGSPDIFPPAEALNALTNSITEPNAHQYQSYKGIPTLRKAMANFYQKRFDVSVDFDSEVLPLMGSKEGIMHLSMAFLNKGDEVLIPNPGYPTYTSITKLLECKPIYYPLSASNNWQPDFTFLNSLNTERTKILWLNYPHMPTGAKAERDTYEKIVSWATEQKILVVNDNPYSFILNDSPMSLLSFTDDTSKDYVMELNSLSKTFNMAGWRIGMLLGSSGNIDKVLKVKSNMDSGMFFGIQQGAIAALNDCDSWIENLNGIYQKRKEKIVQIARLLNLEFEEEGVGMFLWTKIKENVDSVTFTENLLNDKGIFLAPGSIFGSEGEGYVRFSLCVPEAQIEKVLNQLS